MKRIAGLKKTAAGFRKDESGATLVEYAAAVGIVLLVGVLGFQAIGTNANTNFNDTAAVLETVNP